MTEMKWIYGRDNLSPEKWDNKLHLREILQIDSKLTDKYRVFHKNVRCHNCLLSDAIYFLSQICTIKSVLVFYANQTCTFFQFYSLLYAYTVQGGPYVFKW